PALTSNQGSKRRESPFPLGSSPTPIKLACSRLSKKLHRSGSPNCPQSSALYRAKSQSSPGSCPILKPNWPEAPVLKRYQAELDSMEPVEVRSRQPLAACPLKSSMPKPWVPPLTGVLPQMGIAWPHSGETCAWAKVQKKKTIAIFMIWDIIKDCGFGMYKNTTALYRTIIYVAKPPLTDVKSSINVYLCYLEVTGMKLEQTLEEQHDDMGNDHFTSSARTPLREDAFELSDEEKVERIQKNVREIMLTLGLDLSDDSLNGTPKR